MFEDREKAKSEQIYNNPREQVQETLGGFQSEIENLDKFDSNSKVDQEKYNVKFLVVSREAMSEIVIFGIDF